MTKKILGIIFCMLLASSMLIACDTNTPPPPTVTLTGTSEALPDPSSTPIPPTETATTTSTPSATLPPTNTPTPAVYGPNNYPANINPLTGLAVESSLLDRRPVAIKINIVPRSSNRPPWGLSLADIVYDYYHNAGYTRFHAIFYGQDSELVGPIRSARLLDHELIQMYKSVFAYGSADQEVNKYILNSYYSNQVVLEGKRSDCPPTDENPMCRYEPSGSDFLLAGTAELSAHITDKGVENGRQNLSGMSFNPTTPPNGTPASQVFLRYSGDDYRRWDFDASTGKYLRFQDNFYDQGEGEQYAPLTDRVNDQQITTDNVVILVARHLYVQQPPNEIIQINLAGSGVAYAFRDGQAYKVTWNRPAPDSVLYLTNPDGTAFPFKPGNTWFMVVGESSVVEQLENNTWRFTNKLP